jgi:preprotein translocase subunit YajC
MPSGIAEFTPILQQVPLVAIFMIYIWRRDEQWQKFYERQVAKVQQEKTENCMTMREAIDGLSTQVAKNTVVTIMHDATSKGNNPQGLGSTQDIMDKVTK